MVVLLDPDQDYWGSVMKSLIERYLLPKEADFNKALQNQVNASRDTILDLHEYCFEGNHEALIRIIEDSRHCRTIKNQNMRELLDVFITPYDRESIYRIINQIDWVALSAKHLAIDLKIFQIVCPDNYQPIFSSLREMADALAEGFVFLEEEKMHEIVRVVNEIYVHYDQAVEQCVLAASEHLNNDEIRIFLSHREVLMQMKEVAKRIHVSANTLEDMAMKIV